MRWLAPLAVSSLVWGCYPADNVCSSHDEPVIGVDGGEFRCVRPEDCPRPDNVLVCTNDSPYQPDCMSCTDTRCIQHVAEPCQQ